MITLLGIVTLGRLPDEQQRHKQLLRELKKIMATQTEIVAQLNAVNEKLVAATAKITKIGTETDSLLTKILALEEIINAGTVSPELQAALDAVKAQADVIESTATGVDDKVPDA